MRRYPLRIVNSDGSCFDVMHSEPHAIFHVPYDTSHMNTDQLAKYKLERKTKVNKKQRAKKKEVVSDDAIDFDHTNFGKFL